LCAMIGSSDMIRCWSLGYESAILTTKYHSA
jgi:hypothetical protein